MKLGYISSIHNKGDRINPIMKTSGRLKKHRLEEEYVILEEQ
jgi:hypothetical protein